MKRYLSILDKYLCFWEIHGAFGQISLGDELVAERARMMYIG